MPTPKPRSWPCRRQVLRTCCAASRIAHGHLDCSLGRFWRGQGVIEENHDPITAVMVESALVARHNRPERGVVDAQQGHDLFRLGALGEGGEAADVAEHDDDLATMTFEDAFVAMGYDQVCQLWR